MSHCEPVMAVGSLCVPLVDGLSLWNLIVVDGPPMAVTLVPSMLVVGPRSLLPVDRTMNHRSFLVTSRVALSLVLEALPRRRDLEQVILTSHRWLVPRVQLVVVV